MDKKTYYFIGIGGIGMSAIARYLLANGNRVFGYDRVRSPLTEELEKEGMDIVYSEQLSHIESQNIDLVIYTPAIPKDNKLLLYAFEHKLPTIKRSEALGEITRGKKALAVAGTHGKTTTTGLIAHILNKSHVGCSAFLGGISNNYNTNCLINPSSDFVVVEADEYDRSFLRLSPYISVITSVSEDHLDIYGNLNNLQEAFCQFAQKTCEGGKLLLKSDLSITPQTKAPKERYSIEDSAADYHISNLIIEDGGYCFDFHTPQKTYSDMRMSYPGRHNVENAVAAMAVALAVGVTEEELRQALATFSGMKRRFDLKIKTASTVYYDDYAHHPEEIEATLSSLKELYPQKRICSIFQPHLYSRTRDFAAQFAKALELSDEIILLPIYPAREEPISGISSKTIFDLIENKDKYLLEKEESIQRVRNLKGCLIVTIGAGDIDRMVDKITETIKENE